MRATANWVAAISFLFGLDGQATETRLIPIHAFLLALMIFSPCTSEWKLNLFSLSLPRLTESHPYLVIEALLIHDPVRMLFKFDFFLNRYHGVGRSCYPGGLPLDVWHHIMSFLKEMHLPSIVAFATNRAHADILQRICRREYVKRTAIETKISWPDVDPLIDWDRLYSLDDPSFYSECTLIATHKMLGIYNQFGMRAMSSPQIPVEVYPSDPGDKILR